MRKTLDSHKTARLGITVTTPPAGGNSRYCIAAFHTVVNRTQDLFSFQFHAAISPILVYHSISIYKAFSFFHRVPQRFKFILNIIFIIIMIESKEIKSAEHESPVDRAIRRVKAMMMNWGFAEGCSTIYAVLIASREPLSAEEIGERTNYAYSSTINYLNTLIRMGLVERVRRVRKNLYVANVNFVERIKAEREKVKGYLNQLGADLEGIKDLEHLREKVEHAIAYLRRVESAVDKGEE